MAKTNGRKPDGTFAEGNPGGPGRPKRATETSYLLALSEVVTIEDMQAIGRKAVADAKTGDARARDWVSKYILGETPLSLALAMEAVGSDPISSLLLSISGYLMQNNAADMGVIQELADIIKERRLGRKPTDIDRMLESIEIGNHVVVNQVLDDLG